MKYIILSIATILSLIVGSTAHAAPAYVERHVADAALQGMGRLRVFGMDVYDAALYAPKAKAKANKPLAIEITYLRPLTSARIVGRTIDEMNHLGYNDAAKITSWRSQMDKIIPAVTPGTKITGVRTQAGETIFYKNGQKVGVVADREFSQAFFDIWLSEKTNSPSLRKKLLGVAKQ